MVEVIKKEEEEVRKEEKSKSRWSAWLGLALLVSLVAFVVVSWSTASPKIGSFTRTDKGDGPCSCSKDKREYRGTVGDCCCDYETVKWKCNIWALSRQEELHMSNGGAIALSGLMMEYTSEGLCQEEKILYKLISGLHSSISVHIAADYSLDEETNLWGPNLSLLNDRVLRYPDRVRNLYFTFLSVLRATTEAADYLEHAEYDTGNSEDLKVHSLMKLLLYDPKLQAACPIPFDEAKRWSFEDGLLDGLFTRKEVVCTTKHRGLELDGSLHGSQWLFLPQNKFLSNHSRTNRSPSLSLFFLLKSKRNQNLKAIITLKDTTDRATGRSNSALFCPPLSRTRLRASALLLRILR